MQTLGFQKVRGGVLREGLESGFEPGSAHLWQCVLPTAYTFRKTTPRLFLGGGKSTSPPCLPLGKLSQSLTSPLRLTLRYLFRAAEARTPLSSNTPSCGPSLIGWSSFCHELGWFIYFLFTYSFIQLPNSFLLITYLIPDTGLGVRETAMSERNKSPPSWHSHSRGDKLYPCKLIKDHFREP